MKYLVKTVKVNGEEKIDARRDSFNKTKSIYCVKYEDGKVLTVDKDWLKQHKEELVNVGISGDSLYLKAYKKENKENKKVVNKKGKLTDEECQQMIQTFGGQIKRLNTACGNPCYLSSKSETEHLIYIPLNVAQLNSVSDGAWQETDFTPQIEDLKGSLKVIGGSGLQDCFGMFCDCESLQSLDLNNFDTSKVKTMKWMFSGCKSVEFLDLSTFDTHNVTDMIRMFFYCKSLKSLDLSNFNTSKVKDMYGMFSACHSLQSLDLSSFDTSKVEYMSWMFYGCCKLEKIDLSSFDTSKVKDMDYMFNGCWSLQSLDLSTFDTSNVGNMKEMFFGCKSLQSLDLSNFDTSKVIYMYGMFYRCKSLVSVKGNKDIQQAYYERALN